jgi:hypothetical protein
MHDFAFRSLLKAISLSHVCRDNAETEGGANGPKLD